MKGMGITNINWYKGNTENFFARFITIVEFWILHYNGPKIEENFLQAMTQFVL